MRWAVLKHFIAQGGTAIVVGLSTWYVVETWLDEPIRRFFYWLMG